MKTHESIQLSEYDDSNPIDLTDDDIEIIESQIDGLNIEYKKDGKSILHTDHRVGVVALPSGPTIQIRPKVGDPNLVTLLRYANGTKPTHLSREAELESGTNFVDTVAALYLEELEEVLSHGLKREYISVEGREDYLRGRLNVRRQLAGGPGKTDFECEYDEFTYDTTLNQILLRVTNVLSTLVDSSEIAGELREHESRLRQRITLRKISKVEAEQIELTRLTDYYERILELSRLVLKNTYIEDIVEGEGSSYSLLIGMNNVFEKLVERTAQGVLDNRDGWSIESQAPNSSLLTGTPSIRIQPDLVIKHYGEPMLVGDAKWKTEIKNRDVYQVVAYQTAYDVPSVLIYPDNNGNLKNNYSIENGKEIHMLELPTGINTADVDEFGRKNIERFSKFLSSKCFQTD